MAAASILAGAGARRRRRRSGACPGKRHRAGLCIVGGGFTGLWTAILAKRARPELDVVVLEADICGAGASGRNGGCVLTWSTKFFTLRRLFGEAEAAAARAGVRAGRDGHRGVLHRARHRMRVAAPRHTLHRDLASPARRVRRRDCRARGLRHRFVAASATAAAAAANRFPSAPGGLVFAAGGHRATGQAGARLAPRRARHGHAAA